jgi:transketolase|tara:strand:- start:7289 stop:8125 length:837 start_codon:yes stop_codon:yes gene_type:complete
MTKIKNYNSKDIQKFLLNVKKNILDMAFYAGASSSHFGGALSIAEIVSFLFSYQMKIDRNNPLWEDRDRFILSKGHACLAYYSALCEVGYLTKDELKTFEKDKSNLLGHPVINRKIGIEFSNGSLGMGLSLGIGVALASRLNKKNYNVYVVVGDGECNEGAVWEAAMAAPNINLENLYVIIDKNNFQQTGSNKNIMNVDDLKEKWSSFGWHTSSIDGHNFDDMFKCFKNIKNIKKPKAILANTIKGKGFSFSENNNDWHHSVLNKTYYEKGLAELSKN